MGTTPTLGLPYPEQAEPADVPTDMRELAEAVETQLVGLDARLDVLAGFVKIADLRLGSSALFDFTNIPQTFAHLFFLFSLRSTEPTFTNFAYLRLNGDASAVYDWSRVFNPSATTMGHQENFATPWMAFGNIVAATSLANLYAGGSGWLFDYRSAQFKQMMSAARQQYNTGTFQQGQEYLAGTWRSAAAIDRLSFYPSSGASFAAGSRISVYGVAA